MSFVRRPIRRRSPVYGHIRPAVEQAAGEDEMIMFPQFNFTDFISYTVMVLIITDLHVTTAVFIDYTRI